MFIDIHTHTGLFQGPPREDGTNYATPEQLIERYDKIGVEKAVILPSVSPECMISPQTTEEVLEICKRYPCLLYTSDAADE